jgi:hypothetical protein
MNIKQIPYINDLIKKRKELIFKGEYYSHTQSSDGLQTDYQNLDISVKVIEWNKDFYIERGNSAQNIKIPLEETKRLFAMVKKYNEEELARVENELTNLGVEVE